MSNGQGCTCNAWAANECACGADWTPQEVYDLRAENNRLKAELAEAKKDAERWKYARRKICFTCNGDGTCMMHGINLPAAIPGWPDPGKVEEFCDAAIDAAMKGK